MQVEIGKIYEGIVKSIAKYGTFVEMHGSEGERLMGMVHISEVSRSYVNEIRDYVTEGQMVQVKVIGVSPEGKISLSMKQVEENADRNRGERHSGRPTKEEGSQRTPRRNHSKPNVWEPKKRQEPTELSFEDMLSRFKQNSEERMCDIKRNTERKNRTRRK